MRNDPAAPWLPIPSRAISVVEHPCIVKNLDKGIASLGGPARLSKGLRSRLETTTNADGDDEVKKIIAVSLRPGDPFAKRLLSTPVRTNNLLFKVTVPRRTGRRRRRGSSGPFLAPDESTQSHGHEVATGPTSCHSVHVDATTVFRSLRDNASTYKVSLVGIVDETHRFRSMPDIQYTASQNDAMLHLRQYVLPQRLSLLKQYAPVTNAGADLARSIGPSAEFLQMPIAFNYRFQQNTFVKYTDQGVINLQRSIAFNAYTIIKPTEEVVPWGPKATLPPEESLTPYLQSLIKQIKSELVKRPIITRHLLYNKLGWDKRTKLRQAAVYCGYFFESGPWREALIRWGVDPRKDPEFRRFQTVSFMSYLKSGKTKHNKTFDQHVYNLSRMSREELETEHTFDGFRVSRTGNLFQFCDITDPLIVKILATKDIRTTCAPTFQGWYHVGTWAKATVVLKDKMNTILAKGTADNAIYERVVAWPELWDDKEMAAQYKEEINDRLAHQQRRREHEVMHNVRWAARNPRYAFEKMEAASQPIQDATDEEAAQDQDEPDVPEDLTEAPVTADAIFNEDGGDVDDEMDGEEEEGPNEGDEGEDEDQSETGDGQDEEDMDGRWETEDADEDEDEDVDDDEDERGTGLVSARPVTQGPIPFGGLYRI